MKVSVSALAAKYYQYTKCTACQLCTAAMNTGNKCTNKYVSVQILITAVAATLAELFYSSV